MYGTLDHAIDDQDIGQPDGNVSMKEAAWATRKGLFSPASHDAFRECLRLIKEQSSTGLKTFSARVTRPLVTRGS